MQMAHLPLTEQCADKEASQMAQKKRLWKDIGGNRSGKSELVHPPGKHSETFHCNSSCT